MGNIYFRSIYIGHPNKMLRRQLISDELRYSHQTSPRKTRTVQGSSLFQPTLLYKSDVAVFDPSDWVGREFVPWNGENIESYKRSVFLGTNNPDYVSEFEIANYAKPNMYRIVYVIRCQGHLYFKSKPNIEYIPSRLNLLITPSDNIIRKVAYF